MSKQSSQNNKINFSWTFIILPAAIVALSVIIAAIFYSKLPADVAYHFKDGLPDRWTSRGTMLILTLFPQFIFFFFSLILCSLMLLLVRRFEKARGNQVKTLISIMGNMLALPQIILLFAMLSVFLYNSYQITLIPLWVFSVIVIVAGSVILAIFFIRTARRLRGQV